MTSGQSDGELVLRVRVGDLDALGELYERYKGAVYRTALAITRDESVAEDVLQETFLRTCTYAHSIDENLPLGPWLYRVAVNLSYSWSSRVKRWLNVLQETFDQWVVPTCRSPEALTEEREWQQALMCAIDALPDRHRTVVILYYLEELTLKEIAYVMDLPEGTVKSRLYYAREMLRAHLDEQERRLIPEVVYDFT